MTFSIAITTYNRPVNLAKLVSQIESCTRIPDQILVVDSSEQPDAVISANKVVTYIRSSHKNQPYQRYLAYLCCRTEIIIFLDDDLEITDFTVFDVMLSRFQITGASGISVGFEHHNAITRQSEFSVNEKSRVFKIINFLSGVPVMKPGKIYMAGLAGPRPKEEAAVEYFNGAVMGFYKADLSHLFDPVLFSLFEQRLGMGEDKIISMTLGLKKRIWFVPKAFFIHPPSPSNYFLDHTTFQRKVMYSRLLVSLRYAASKGYPKGLAFLHYYYFAGWRLLIALFRNLIKPGPQNRDLTKGIYEGIMLTFTLPFRAEKITPEINWQRDAENDVAD